MRSSPFTTKKHTSKVDLSKAKAVANGTIPVAATPFPLRDSTYYQVNAAGDYVQEVGG